MYVKHALFCKNEKNSLTHFTFIIRTMMKKAIEDDDLFPLYKERNMRRISTSASICPEVPPSLSPRARRKMKGKMAPVGAHGGNRTGDDEAEPSSRRGRRRLKKKAIKDDDNDVQITRWEETQEELDEYYKKRGDFYKNGYIRSMLLDLEMDEDIVGDENYEIIRALMDPLSLRKITEAELLAYNKQLKESGVFHLVDVPLNISDVDIIHPCPNFEKYPRLFEDVKRSSMKAIDFYNRKHRLEGKYQFVRVLKLCTIQVEGFCHYITFEAKAEDADPLCFQAEVYVPIEVETAEIEVISCRLKPAS